MKTTFVSNYINHHQIPFCDALYRRLGEDFTFIQTEPMEEERVRMGWGESLKALPYVKLLYEEEALCRQRIDDCDLLLAGWMENPELIFDRLESGRPALRISERIYREGQWKAVSPKGLAAKYKEHIRYRNKPVYLLCAGAYVASDFTLIHAYPGKMLRFGYFPEAKKPDQQAEKPKGGPVRLLWAGRLMELKHPEFALHLAADLRREGYDFRLKLIGGGELEEKLKEQIRQEELSGLVEMTGFLSPREVRLAMEESHIFLFTSNHLEGWGAVVNEAMNSRCAVVASEEAGAVPYLIRHGENGMIYHRDRYEDFLGAVRRLMESEKDRERMGKCACDTILTEWNADTAAERCLKLYEGWQKGKITFPEQGPLSHAPVIRPWK